MLVHPWNAGLDEAEWQTWIADGHDFGQLAVNGLPGHPPMVVPTLAAAQQQLRRLDRIGAWTP
jgi:hypothetical protein